MTSKLDFEKITFFLEQDTLSRNIFIERFLNKKNLFDEYTSPIQISKDIYFSILSCYDGFFPKEVAKDFSFVTSMFILKESKFEQPSIGLYHVRLDDVEYELRKIHNNSN